VVWFQHGLLAPEHLSLLDRVLASLPAREVWLPSQHTAAAYRRAAPDLPVRVIYPSVDLDRFHPSHLPSRVEARRRLRLPSAGPLVGMVTRLEPWKGCATLVAAAPEILRHTPKAHFVIVGGPHFRAPDYPQQLLAQANALGVADRFIWAGHQTEAPLWMQALDVVVHASWGEPFGMTVVEAMALGKALVASASGGPLESVRDGVDGRLVPPGRPDALAQAVSWFLMHPDEIVTFGRRGQERAQRFSATEMATAIGTSFRQLFL
jgi:glycosyltransferase involved in cell wall biosynthesis